MSILVELTEEEAAAIQTALGHFGEYLREVGHVDYDEDDLAPARQHNNAAYDAISRAIAI